MSASTTEHDDHAAPSFDIESYLSGSLKQLASADTQKIITEMSATFKKLSANTERTSKMEAAEKLAAMYARLRDPMGNAYYVGEAAALANDTIHWVLSGNRWLALSQGVEQQDIKSFTSKKAETAYSKAVELSPTVSNKVKLASAYVEGGENPMKGIGMLLEIVRADSTVEEAQFTLGRFSLVSGQYDKAINRFEKVLSLRPQNSEAMFLLAEAYRGSGNKQKAIELFEKCRKQVDNPELRKEIDSYIANIKNS
jgi:tetratricopeptide (TPR) repeat protein